MEHAHKAPLEPEPSPWAFTMGDRLAKALAVANVPHAEMAEYLGISGNTIGNYIAGRTRPKKQTLRLWALRTGAPLEWIETGEERHVNDRKTFANAVITNINDWRKTA